MCNQQLGCTWITSLKPTLHIIWATGNCLITTHYCLILNCLYTQFGLQVLKASMVKCWYPWMVSSIDTWLTTVITQWLTLDEHLSQQSIKSRLIFANIPLSAYWYMYESVDTPPTIDQLSTRLCQSDVKWDVDSVLTEHRLRCPKRWSVNNRQ